MSVDAIDLASTYSLSEWLRSEEAGKTQRDLEEKITLFLFSHDPESSAFEEIAAQLAWLGSQPEAKPLLARDIRALNDFSVELCSLRKRIKKISKFMSKHALEIVGGIAICATGIGIAYATGYVLSASVGGVVVAGAGSIFHSEKEKNPKIPSTPLPNPRACSNEELAFLLSQPTASLPKVELPSSGNELLITTNGIWANGQFFSTDPLRKHSILTSDLVKDNPVVSHGEINWQTFAYYNYLSGQEIGKNALALGFYDQAIQTINVHPANPTSYLERGAAHFALGQYDWSLEDYQQFTAQPQETHPLSVLDFTIGFAKGLPKGAYESGEGILFFLADFVKHPIQTSKQVVDSITTLADLVRKDEWGLIAESLSPELHQLVTEWDTLPSDTRGELAGYAVGKHGADILLPGALAKIAAKSVKTAQELAAVCKNIQIAQETLVLETAAGIGSSTKIAEIIEAGEKTAKLAEDLGFTTREMGQLKQAGKLETTVANQYEQLSPAMRESFDLHKKAKEALEPFVKKPLLESSVRELIHEMGIPTFPRPKGIPEDFLVMVSGKGAGMEYVHPTNTHIRIRVMPGKPHSPNPSQQKPYVIQQKSGKAFDKHGNLIQPEKPEAHIPLEEFVYRE